jgi:hypothetical protein
MFMKIKDKYKKSERPAVCGFPMVARYDRSTAKSREQSQNVYENKGQKVAD